MPFSLPGMLAHGFVLIVDYIQTACSDVINRIVPQVIHNRFTTLNKK